MPGIRSSAPKADWATAVVLVFAAALPSLLTWLYFIVLAGDDRFGPLRKAVYGAGKVVQFALPLAFALCGRGACRGRRGRE